MLDRQRGKRQDDSFGNGWWRCVLIDQDRQLFVPRCLRRAGRNQFSRIDSNSGMAIDALIWALRSNWVILQPDTGDYRAPVTITDYVLQDAEAGTVDFTQPLPIGVEAYWTGDWKGGSATEPARSR